MKNLTLLIILVFSILSSSVLAQTPGVTSFSGGSQFSSFYGSALGDVIGYRFTVSSSISVTDLGIWNNDNNGGVDSDHMVGIWDGSGTLLTSGTVTTAGTVVGDWIYAPVTPVTLDPGQTYTAGAMYTVNDNDNYVSSPSSVNSATEVTVVNGVFPLSGDLGFVYPTENSTNLARFGPNFLFGPAIPPAVPTLSEWGLIILTLLLLTAGTLALRYRKRMSPVT